MPRIQGKRLGHYATEAFANGELTGKMFVQDTFTCGHCQRITNVGHGQVLDDLGGMCLKCMRPCCKVCTREMTSGPLRTTTSGTGCWYAWENQHDRKEAEANGRARFKEQFTTDLERRVREKMKQENRAGEFPERNDFLNSLEAEHRA